MMFCYVVIATLLKYVGSYTSSILHASEINIRQKIFSLTIHVFILFITEFKISSKCSIIDVVRKLIIYY